jgi:hypothetical protein
MTAVDGSPVSRLRSASTANCEHIAEERRRLNALLTVLPDRGCIQRY